MGTNDEQQAEPTDNEPNGEIVNVGGSATAAMEARAKTEVQARFVVAQKNPRNWEDVRVKLLKECNRKGFAATARFAKPTGEKTVRGFNIRFAEAAMRMAGNLDVQVSVALDDPAKRVMRVSLVDLETNSGKSQEVTVDKTVERHQSRKGDRVLGERRNSAGNTVYILQATSDQVTVKVNSETQRAARNLVLAFFPKDILDECEGAIDATIKAEIARDVISARREILDLFARFNVMPSELSSFLGHPFEQSSIEEYQTIREIARAIIDQDTSWAEVVASRGKDATVVAEGASMADRTQSTAERIKGRTTAKAAAKDEKGEGK